MISPSAPVLRLVSNKPDMTVGDSAPNGLRHIRLVNLEALEEALPERIRLGFSQRQHAGEGYWVAELESG